MLCNHSRVKLESIIKKVTKNVYVNKNWEELLNYSCMKEEMAFEIKKIWKVMIIQRIKTCA